MKKCELCGAEVQTDLKACSRCGFEFQRQIRADSRDRALLERHTGKEVEDVKRELRKSQSKLAAYLDNIKARELSIEELVPLVDESLKNLQIPLILGAEDELKFNREEVEFIGLISGCLVNADLKSGRPVGNEVTYIKLSNALMSLGKHGEALAMIEKALLINPRDRDALYCKAKLLFDMQRYGAAKKCLDKLTASGNDDNARYLSELIDQLDCQSE